MMIVNTLDGVIGSSRNMGDIGNNNSRSADNTNDTGSIMNRYPTLTIAHFLSLVGPYLLLDLPTYGTKHPTGGSILSPDAYTDLVNKCIDIDSLQEV